MTDTSPPTPSEQGKIDPVFLDDLADAVDERDISWLSRTLKRMHPADAADALEALP
jgi:magnesium transporter